MAALLIRWTMTGLILVASLAVAGCRIVPRTKAVEDHVVAARELTREGMASMVRRRWDEAEKKLLQAVKACPEDCAARQQYAEALWHQGQQKEAIDQLQQAVTMSETPQPQLLVRLGEMHLQLDRRALANRYADQALRCDVQSAEAWQLWGAVLEHGQQLPEALAAYQRAMSLAPDLMSARMAAARVYLKQERPQRALTTLARLETDQPAERRGLEWWKLKSAAQFALAQPEQAAETLSAALEVVDADVDLYRQLATAGLAAENIDQATWALKQAQQFATAEDAAQLVPLQKRLEVLRLAALPETPSHRQQLPHEQCPDPDHPHD